MSAASRERVFSFVRERILAGFPPTVREVQQALGFRSSGTAREHLDRLVGTGRLIRQPGVSRGFRLPPTTGLQRPAASIPILGRVQAGALSLGVQDIEGHLWVQARYPAEELFALRVRGTSMTGAGILPDDLVVVHRQPGADSGQVVVALVDGETTVKVFKRRRGRIELHPANPDFPVIIPELDRLSILGRVIEVRRHLEPQA